MGQCDAWALLLAGGQLFADSVLHSHWCTRRRFGTDGVARRERKPVCEPGRVAQRGEVHEGKGKQAARWRRFGQERKLSAARHGGSKHFKTKYFQWMWHFLPSACFNCAFGLLLGGDRRVRGCRGFMSRDSDKTSPALQQRGTSNSVHIKARLLMQSVPCAGSHACPALLLVCTLLLLRLLTRL